MATKSLSPKSPFESIFKTRYRGPGRPAESETFSPVDVHPVIKQQAQRRAYAVLHEESKARLDEVFLEEVAVLRRRGVEVVAADCGVSLGASLLGSGAADG